MKPVVLVVDDEPAIADGLRLILEREGYAVETAVNTAEAAARLDATEATQLARQPRFGHNKARLANQFEPCVTVWGYWGAARRFTQDNVYPELGQAHAAACARRRVSPR